MTLATTLHLSLHEVVARLTQSKAVAAVVAIGSLAENRLTPASDYDLVIILHELAPAWTVGVTQIDHRFTDLILVAATAVDEILALTAPVAEDHPLAPVIRWLRQGKILFDYTQIAKKVQNKVREADWLQPIADSAAYAAWFSINYNLAQAQRMMQASDPLYRQTVAIRLAVYGHMDVWFGYFTIRKLAWDGDKPAVQYLLKHDLAFLDHYEQFIRETDISQKMTLYAQVAALATAPLGGLWPSGATVINEEKEADLWQRLLGERQ